MKNILYAIILSFLFSFVCLADFQAGDVETAYKEVKTAAEQGHATAQSVLGLMYGAGRGVIRNFVIAYMWLNIAASKGDKGAETNRDSVRKQMTSEQIAKAQELARECVEKNYKDCA